MSKSFSISSSGFNQKKKVAFPLFVSPMESSRNAKKDQSESDEEEHPTGHSPHSILTIKVNDDSVCIIWYLSFSVAPQTICTKISSITYLNANRTLDQETTLCLQKINKQKSQKKKKKKPLMMKKKNLVLQQSNFRASPK